MKKLMKLVPSILCLVLSAGAAGDPVADGRALGYQLDVSRCKVPTMPTLRRIVDILASLGYNQFQLYTEHTFAYSRHETAWRGASPMTPDEVRALDAYCAARGIELVPNQNSFGHLERWLCHPEYNGLAELPAGGAVYKRWGNYVTKSPRSLCPTDPRSAEFVAGLYDELLPCFRSKYVNVGGDETVELKDNHEPRLGRSAAAIAASSPERVYLGFLKRIHALCAARGHTMMFWGDIILEKPELIPELPENAICLNWGYEANHPFERQTAAFEAAKRRFVVCPGTSAWGTLSGRTANMMSNITNAFGAAERHGAMGALLADWGDGGHPNPWVVSVPALVFAAHRAKGVTLTRAALSAEIDKVLGCRCGAALLAYGDIYEKVRGRMGNSAELYTLLEEGADYERGEGVTDETLRAGLDHQRYAKSLADLASAPEWVRDDFAMLDLLYRAVADRIAEPKKKNFRAQFEPEYRRLWLKQNRVGGLAESLNWVFGFVR